MVTVKRALISVYHKTGLDVFARGLQQLGIEIVSTGGTAAFLEEHGIPVVPLSQFTGFTEILGGRVKTLHPKVHGALLALRDDPQHTRDREAFGIDLLDLVVVNLYPFEDTIRRAGVTPEEAIEQIDIGGPAMLRSAAKNFRHVAVVSRPEQYAGVLEELRQCQGQLSERTTSRLAADAFLLTSTYDAAIAEYCSRRARQSGDQLQETSDTFPDQFSLAFTKVQDLRYGENPHQRAALYRSAEDVPASLATARQLHGKQLSYNNILDMDAAWRIVSDLRMPSAAVIKHNTPCGVASSDRLDTAYKQAYSSDPVSAYGGIVAFNRRVDEATAKLLSETRFVECVVASDFAKSALRLLTQKKNVRLVVVGRHSDHTVGGKVVGGSAAHSGAAGLSRQVVPIAGGALVQDVDRRPTPAQDIARASVVSRRRPTDAQMRSLEFAWTVAKHTKSNAIVVVKGTATVGIGAGNTSRVGAVEEALKKAGARANGGCLASDGFFPMADGVITAGKHGIRAVVQPGGSIRDQEVVEAADRFKIAMLCTGVRHFKH